jgi:DNA-binding response OmpR family regulator
VTKPKILIVEDEPNMVMGLTDNFELEGYEVISANDGEVGLSKAIGEKPDLVILDIMMPKKSGLDVCKELRAKGYTMPVVMLTARGQEIDKVVGLELGADDYVPKPFNPRELLARVRSVLRRSAGAAEPTGAPPFRSGELEIDFDSRAVTLGGARLELTHYEFELLAALARSAGRVLSREQLLDALTGRAYESFDRSIDVHISKLRAKIEPNPKEPRYIMTVRGVGYILARDA